MEDDPLNDTLILTPEERERLLKEGSKEEVQDNEKDEDQAG